MAAWAARACTLAGRDLTAAEHALYLPTTESSPQCPARRRTADPAVDPRAGGARADPAGPGDGGEAAREPVTFDCRVAMIYVLGGRDDLLRRMGLRPCSLGL
ncbi:hypothetical protein [Frankia sp. CiP3]|uniref:hypothetical protein n=1 Tax=Frankia sp. CiP3 TaxID=2880971 RepID=UPI001EF51CFC|nr:hypothetical protein [Frankia sp. CiP3]